MSSQPAREDGRADDRHDHPHEAVADDKGSLGAGETGFFGQTALPKLSFRAELILR
jgi:hypothetical protein